MKINHKFNYLELYEYYLALRSNTNIDNLKKLYSKIKELSVYYYNNGKMNKKYNDLLGILMKSENLFKGKYILSKDIDVDRDLKLSIDATKEEIIKYIVNETRLFLDSIYRAYRVESKDINEYSFENMCGYASFKVIELCNSLGIKSHIINIEPGYIKESDLFNGGNHHYCAIIEFDNEYFLIDCTYKQFFKLGKTNIDRLGIINCSPPRVGTYMMMNEKRKELAEDLLKNGYIKLTEENFKDYMDGFTISFRNGLYYEQTKDLNFKTKYTVNDYINFLKEKDSQIQHESKELLGFQRKPLDDNKMVFKLGQ